MWATCVLVGYSTTACSLIILNNCPQNMASSCIRHSQIDVKHHQKTSAFMVITNSHPLLSLSGGGWETNSLHGLLSYWALSVSLHQGWHLLANGWTSSWALVRCNFHFTTVINKYCICNYSTHMSFGGDFPSNSLYCCNFWRVARSKCSEFDVE